VVLILLQKSQIFMELMELGSCSTFCTALFLRNGETNLKLLIFSRSERGVEQVRSLSQQQVPASNLRRTILLSPCPDDPQAWIISDCLFQESILLQCNIHASLRISDEMQDEEDSPPRSLTSVHYSTLLLKALSYLYHFLASGHRALTAFVLRRES
jgi:hypothetical protein